MAICYLGCDEDLSQRIHSFPKFQNAEIIETQFPITASSVDIELLITGPAIRNHLRLAATISDWNIPPVALLIFESSDYEERSEILRHHPRVGRSIFFCKNTAADIEAGLEAIYQFHKKRESLPLDHQVSGNYNTNNISPRWLFQTLMEHLDEYIYFKDADSRFLAVSRYLADSCGKDSPTEVLGLRDFDIFDQAHADEAYADERKIATGELQELYKEEVVKKGEELRWVASRKLPLRTRSGYLAGSFGLSRDVTESKELHQQLEDNHERMQSELLLARNLQRNLMQQGVPEFLRSDGTAALELATKYIPSFHLSGDFYSVVKTDEGGAAILVADVMGHGVRAAMVTAMIQIAVQQLREYANQPSTFMKRLNTMMKQTMQASGQTIFATAVYCYIDLDNKQLSYSQAGSRHGVHVPSGNSKQARIFDSSAISPALGLIPDAPFAETQMQLAPGDEVILYTDGIIEAAMGDEEYSEKRMVSFLVEHRREQLPDMLDQLLDSVKEFTQSKDLQDDVCLVGLRIHSTTIQPGSVPGIQRVCTELGAQPITLRKTLEKCI